MNGKEYIDNIITPMMKKLILFLLIIVSLVYLAACDRSPIEVEVPTSETPSIQSPGQIYLYGESHGVDKIIDKEFCNRLYKNRRFCHKTVLPL